MNFCWMLRSRGSASASGELSMYNDIATMDRGPGLLNGILSLILNSTQPRTRTRRKSSGRSRISIVRRPPNWSRCSTARFPNSPHRAGLHARLIETYSAYGESGAVIREGRQFLSAFPDAPQREQVALLLADAYARENRAAGGVRALRCVAGGTCQRTQKRSARRRLLITDRSPARGTRRNRAEREAAEGESEEGEPEAPQQKNPESQRAFAVSAVPEVSTKRQAFAGVFPACLSDICRDWSSMSQVPQALAVLRKEMDRNPNDPGLYERLAQFLQQNQLGRQQEQVYQRAIQQFPDRSWYHKLARFYLREKRQADFDRLSEQVVKIFSGTELEITSRSVGVGGDYYMRLNEFAHARFPHDLLFVRNLLNAYHVGKTERKVGELICVSTGGSLKTCATSTSNICRGPGSLTRNSPRSTRWNRLRQQWHWKELATGKSGGSPVCRRGWSSGARISKRPRR